MLLIYVMSHVGVREEKLFLATPPPALNFVIAADSTSIKLMYVEGC